MIVTLIPAAGASARMRGADKLLEPVDGIPALRHAVQTALAADLGPVLVTLREEDAARRRAVTGLDCQLLSVADASSGMSASLRVGGAAALALLDADRSEGSGLLVHLPDMPDIQSADLVTLAQAFSAAEPHPLRAATQDGTPGHPTLFPTRLLHQFADLTGDQGARSVLATEGVQLVPLPGRAAVMDLDTPEDWERWRAHRSSNTV
ncbi:CTP:molybdopterin cytidylyltransferase [Candidatus Rhodobacter oscarellae]|uniref:CTP:molybdopterin cytidylyltransferase n=1 Tax=Candidatus Rhodobacter oscarellae TaxID=1675527 RepID=A0A0J9E3D9_9RHOB|nr:nucleotidyltransferase family protein [Candidatus Rhodobacter lobularis]KMW57212.1 CTP:molybdopterin cytidylyltransferase [Candidatus Rhodobacter lobularis]